MIVEPDFLTHWKTRALIRTLDYEAAPLCVLALWAHCQQRKADRFHGMTPEVFASICGYPFSEPTKFYDAMLASGFVEMENDTLVVHDFAKANAQLFANWQNGLRGGRPSQTQRKPTDNPSVTHQEPISEMGKPIDKIRVDREEKIDSTLVAFPQFKRKSAAKAAPASSEEWLTGLANQPAYSGIDVHREFSKMENWCRINKKEATQRRFINWLNRVDKPIALNGSAQPAPKGLNQW